MIKEVKKWIPAISLNDKKRYRNNKKKTKNDMKAVRRFLGAREEICNYRIVIKNIECQK
ncbi:MAG TPA: hypothetical protein PLD35_05695 [Caldisericia bacterium]|jgi:hypothetical protein|nr:hypothetical protein [Caldisericia bacterium]